jgi:hypothetical protein
MVRKKRKRKNSIPIGFQLYAHAKWWLQDFPCLGLRAVPKTAQGLLTSMTFSKNSVASSGDAGLE